MTFEELRLLMRIKNLAWWTMYGDDYELVLENQKRRVPENGEGGALEGGGAIHGSAVLGAGGLGYGVGVAGCDCLDGNLPVGEV